MMKRAITLAPLYALATALTASWPARAETIIFDCGVKFAADLTNNTVDNRPAKITATAIDWRVMPGTADDTGVLEYHIDRAAGILSETFAYRLPDGSIRQSDGPTTYHCTSGSAPPAKP